ncbi:hypothetical protein COO60DRAFT_1644433 [Scenedesmus sp. NREL 46B-D3]|nr:hypothetical protein COO60DRAFT_1644433 [Scenedesmus sp. NREL 46B-D3]
MKQKMMETASFRQFQAAVHAKPSLADDWVSFTSRPWVLGPVDMFLGNEQLAAMMGGSPELQETVDSIIAAGDAALQEGEHVPWLLHAVQQVAGHAGVYTAVEAAEQMLGPHRIGRLEGLTRAALTRPRAVKLVAVLAALLTPQVVHGVMALLRACCTDERISSKMDAAEYVLPGDDLLAGASAAAHLMMDAAEYVLSEEDRLVLADLALDQLSDAVTDDGILHVVASLDAAADVQLMLSTGRELLAWLLQAPEAMGAALGELVDAVVNMERLRRAVARNDEVMTLERISLLHKVLAQLSPAVRPDNISSAASLVRGALLSRQLQRWAGAASSSISVQDVKTWWGSVDEALTPRVVEALLHLAESLVDGGRIWAAMGQPQPPLEMLLVADEEARAAACRAACAGGRTAASFDAGDGSTTSSKDRWGAGSIATPDGGAANRSLAESAAAAAAAAAAAPACGIHDASCQECSSSCGSPAARTFAAGATLSDPDLQQLIRHHLDVCSQPRRQQQRRVARQAAQAAAPGAVDGGSAAGDAAAASAAAAAVAAAAAAAASSDCMCSYTSGHNSALHEAKSAAVAEDNDGSSSCSSSNTRHGVGAATVRNLQVEGLVSAARAVLHPKRLPQLLGLLPELLAPQRMAIGLALLDSAAGRGSRRPALLRRLSLLLTLLGAAPRGVVDAAAAAAADVVAAPGSRQQLLHAVDTVLAMLTVTAAATAKTEQAQQQQQQQQHAVNDEGGVNAITSASAAVTAAQTAVPQQGTGVSGVRWLLLQQPA